MLLGGLGWGPVPLDPPLNEALLRSKYNPITLVTAWSRTTADRSTAT